MSVASNLSFEDLPNELKLKICSYLTKSELLSLVAPACRAWRCLSWDPSLWKDLTLCANCDMNEECIFDRTPQLKSFTLLTSRTPIGNILEDLYKCRSLTELNIHSLVRLSGEDFRRLVNSCRSIRYLNVHGGIDINDEAMASITQLEQLRDMHLTCCFHVSDDGLTHVAARCTRLAAITLIGAELATDSGFSQLIEYQSETLEYFAFEGFHSMEKTFESLEKCKRLETLIIYNAEAMTDSNLLKIRNIRSLKHLQINFGSELSAVALKELFEDMVLQNLVFLDLYNCNNLSDDGVRTIARNCRRLKHLELSSCRFVSDDGVKFILQHCRDLITLQLSHQRNTGKCFDVDEFPSKNLIYLELFRCFQISNEIVVRLSMNNLQLEVIDPNGKSVKCGVTSRNVSCKKISVIRQRGLTVVQISGSVLND